LGEPDLCVAPTFMSTIEMRTCAPASVRHRRRRPPAPGLPAGGVALGASRGTSTRSSTIAGDASGGLELPVGVPSQARTPALPRAGHRHPTFYWRARSPDGPTYHIDYVFVPRTSLGRLRSVTIGSRGDWIATGLSDHVPVIVDLELAPEPAPAQR
jgi:hypothetical protein